MSSTLTLAAPLPALKNDFLREFLDNQQIAGAVTLVAQRGEVVHLATTGYADLKMRRLMRTDDLFWVASMTKPITAAAILMLADAGMLSIDDVLGHWLPEFQKPWLIEEKTEDRLVLKRPQRKVTLRDLLRHTHGIPVTPQPEAHASLAEWVRACAREPLEFEPGTHWQYGNEGMNILGRVVEVVTEEPFAAFLQRRFFGPLGMKETTFYPTPSQTKNLPTVYRPSLEPEPLEESPIPLIVGEVASTKRTVFPGGGLFSTAHDMLLFFQMLADGGVANGRRFLSPQAITAMTTTQTGKLAAGFGEGMTYGLGLNVLHTPTNISRMLPSGSYGHDGAAGTSAWIDPHNQLVMVLMMHGTALHRHDIGMRVRAAFHEAAEHDYGDWLPG